MNRKSAYLGLCIIGTIVPYAAFIPWVMEHGLNIPRMVESLFANRISAFFGLDVVVTTLVVWVFIAVEGHRAGVRHLWAPVLASLAVGVSLALPLFLYLRESALDQKPESRVF
ncbi:MAG TPA: DUF2834 domain-containing protein [Vicinamibacterales bacterium]|jgi:hypothetical protein